VTHPVIERRRAEQQAHVDRAASWAAALPDELGVVAVVVFGSVARGDFNKWSDIDVLVIAEHLPSSSRDRIEVLFADRPGGLEPVGWTPAELADRRRRRDPIAREADEIGVVVRGAWPAPER